jgi:double-strand break repair protein MRE11
MSSLHNGNGAEPDSHASQSHNNTTTTNINNNNSDIDNFALEPPNSKTIRLMISTDNHLGYLESDPVRGLDSFAAFEEVLYLAKNVYSCDLVLLAGDLFHDNRPSRRTLHKTLTLLRKYCLGDRPVKLQYCSTGQAVLRNTTVNYHDPYMSVDLPIFSIHGNHDDPSRDTGERSDLLAALDLLSVSNLVNYFGRQEQIDSMNIYPVLLQKGTTRLALYGLGSMREERLHRMWKAGKVQFYKPSAADKSGGHDNDESNDEDGSDDARREEDGSPSYFNVFCLHQNRDLGRGTKNCVQESMVPEWMGE